MTERRVESIDVFRGIAILLVALYHYTARLPADALGVVGPAPFRFDFGWTGVYFFFLISGYCIMLTLERSRTVGVFLARRISRIYPAFLAALLLLFVFQFIVPLPSVPAAHYREAAPGLLDVGLNLFFLGELGEWVNGSFWSIAVEVKFYVLIAGLALLIANRDRMALVFSRIALGGALIWAAALCLQPGNTNALSIQSLLRFLAIAPYLSFFAVGVLARLLVTGRRWTTPHLAIASGTSVIIVWLMQYNGGLATDFVSPTVSAATFAALLGLFLWFAYGRPMPHIPLVTPLLAQVGLLSYSWYLLHEPLGHALLLQLNPILPPYVAVVVTIVLTYVAAWGFAAIFEWRFRKPVEALALKVLDHPILRGRGLTAQA